MPEIFSVRSGVVAHTFSLSTQEAVWDQPGLYRQVQASQGCIVKLSQKKKKKSKVIHHPDIQVLYIKDSKWHIVHLLLEHKP